MIALAVLAILPVIEAKAATEAPAPAAVMPGESLSVSLKPQAAIRGRWILLGDVADLSGLDGSRLAELAALKIARVPMPGVERVLTANELRRKLNSTGVKESFRIAADPDAIRVSAAVKALPGGDLVRFGREYLQGKAARPGADVRIEDPEVPRSLTVPDAEIELRAETSGHKLAGLVPVTVEARCGGERVAQVMLSYRVRARVTAVQAARALEPGCVLVEGDLAEAEADLADVPDDIATSREALLGQRVVRPVSAGGWLRRGSVAQPLQVKRGSQVILVAHVGPVEARAMVQAKEPGASGDIITVVNMNSKRSLKARVIGADMVEAVVR